MFARARLPREKPSRKSAAASGWRANNVRPYKLDPAKSACQPEIKESLCTFFGSVRTTLPQAAAACGLAGASDVSGSWLTGQLAALRARPDLHLTVLCVGKADADGTADGVHYRVVRDTAAFAPLLQAERPDLVHIWGTEFDPEAAAMAGRRRCASEPAGAASASRA